MESSVQTNNFKGYRFVNLAYSPSYINNNLSTCDGECYIYLSNAEAQPKAVFYTKDLIEKGDVAVASTIHWKDLSDCFGVKYVKVQDKWHLVLLLLKSALIYNNNGTRQLTFVESKKKLAEGKVNFFTTATTAYNAPDGKEFIAIGTSSGEIHAVEINGSSTTKTVGFQLVDESAITAMSADSRSKTLAVGNSNGYVMIFSCDNQAEWKPLHNIAPPNEIPVTSIGTLFRGENLYVVGYANGMVKLISTSGQVLVEVQAHSRTLTALACHPSKAVFATCSDDTFMHVFEVSGDKLDKLDVNLILGSRVNDFMLTGIAFGGEGHNSVLAVPYDFKTVIIWNNIV